MKKFLFLAISVLSANFATVADEAAVAAKSYPELDESVVREALASVQRGVNYLTDHQMEDGSWCSHPAITSLAAMAIHGSGTKQNAAIRELAVERARKYILGFVQKDGSIWAAGRENEYPNYTTAIALCALAVIGKQEDEDVMRAARKFLIGLQVGGADKNDPFHGGIGYAKAGPGRPDLSNTQWALEALYLTEYLDKEPFAKSPEDAKKSDLAWKNAVLFLSRLQHLPESNDQVWVVKDKSDPSYGGFVYKPDESKASEKYDDKQSLRSYGSMTYAGLKSMIYAKLAKDDPRIKAAAEWAAKNYKLDENPGMGMEGHYYYLHTFAKAHAVLGEEIVETPDGAKHYWRADIVKKLLELQKGDGHWHNDKHGRWMESIPELVTSYSLLAMEAAIAPEIGGTAAK